MFFPAPNLLCSVLVSLRSARTCRVRLQNQGSVRDRDRREQERQQLADLVGKNLTYLSQLEGLSFQLYRDIVLPRRDPLSGLVLPLLSAGAVAAATAGAVPQC